VQFAIVRYKNPNMALKYFASTTCSLTGIALIWPKKKMNGYKNCYDGTFRPEHF
jgi:hypothetical protein